VYRSQREDIEVVYRTIYRHAVRMADTVGVEPTKPRHVSRMQHRANVPAESTEQYYLRNMAIPFVDYLNSELDNKFTGQSYHNHPFLADQSGRPIGLLVSILPVCL